MPHPQNSQTIRYETRGQIAVISLSDERSRNALSPALLGDLTIALDNVVQDGMKGVLLTSVGKVFCSGGDLASLNDALNGDVDLEVGEMLDRFHTVVRRLADLPAVSIAAVGGAAVGGGVALAMATDVRIASRSATFSGGYVAVGASPDGGASFRLAHALGAPQAVSALLLNSRFTAEQLLQLGLVSELVDDGDLAKTSVEVTTRLSNLPIESVKAVRRLVFSAATNSLDDQLEVERAEFLRVARTDGFRDGIARFARAK